MLEAKTCKLQFENKFPEVENKLHEKKKEREI